jgi:molybdenum cofactor biosynthesis enzyme MoaA
MRALTNKMTNVSIDISDKCNLSCGFCRVYPGTNYMTTQTFDYIRHQINESAYVGIGGGEPLLHPDLREFIVKLIHDGHHVTVSSNMVHEEKAFASVMGFPHDKLHLQASLPCIDPELYANITGQNQVELVLDNLNWIKDQMPVAVNCVVYKANLFNVEDTIDFVAGELGIPIRVGLAYPVGKASDLKILSYDELVKLTEIILVKRIEGMKVISGLRFMDASCTEVEIPCKDNGGYFGIDENQRCMQDKVYYDPQGIKYKCEFARLLI